MKWFCSPCIQDVSHFLDLNKAINIWVGLCINVVDCQNVICSNLAFCSQTCLRFEGFLDGHKDANISIWVSLETLKLSQCLLVSFFVKMPGMQSSEAVGHNSLELQSSDNLLLTLKTHIVHRPNIFHFNSIQHCFTGSLSFCSIYSSPDFEIAPDITPVLLRPTAFLRSREQRPSWAFHSKFCDTTEFFCDIFIANS